MTVFVHGSGKMLGQLRTIDFVTQRGEQAPAIAVTGDKKNPPVDTAALAGNIIDILNGASPGQTIHSTALRTGWIRQDHGLAFYFQDSPDLRDRKSITFHILPGCPDKLGTNINDKLFDNHNLGKLFAMIETGQGPEQDKKPPSPSRPF